MSFAESNLALVRKRFPTLLGRLRNGAEEGSQFIRYAEFQKRSSDWVALLERWLDGIEIKEDQAIVLSGFGDGSHVRALLKHLPLSSHVFVIEASIAGFSDVCRNYNLTDLLEDPRFYLGIGTLDQDCFHSLCRFPTLEVLGADPVIFAPIFNLAPEYYSSGFVEFARSLDYWRKLYGTTVTASGKWQNNTLDNMDVLVRAPDLSVFEGAFSGSSMIVASAGPSLDESLDLIRKHSGEAVIVAVNSSYRALRNAGIVPHFVIAADPYEHTDKGFEGVDCSETVLICPFIVYPKVVRRFVGKVVTWSALNVLVSYLRRKAGLAIGSQVLEMGTVSACAFDVAEMFGCERVLFLGQDLAFRDDGQMHASDSFYSDIGANQFTSQNFRRMPGNTSPTVKVEEKLYVYLKVFESIAKERKGGGAEYCNASRLGARIEGIPYRSLEEADSWIGANQANIGKAFEHVSSQLVGNEHVRQVTFAELEAMRVFAEELCRKALSGAVAIELELSSSEPEKKGGDELLISATTYNEEVQALLQSQPSYVEILNDGALKYEIVLYKRAIKTIEGDEDLESRKIMEYLWAIAEGSFAFAKALTTAIE